MILSQNFKLIRQEFVYIFKLEQLSYFILLLLDDGLISLIFDLISSFKIA